VPLPTASWLAVGTFRTAASQSHTAASHPTSISIELWRTFRAATVRNLELVSVSATLSERAGQQ
jgi:hypothetical protein